MAALEAASVDPRDVSAVLHHVEDLMQQGQLTVARGTVGCALAYNPGEASLYRCMSKVMLAAGNAADALAWAERATKVLPEDSRNQLLIARIHEHRGDVPRLEAALRRAVELNPADVSTLRRLSITLQTNKPAEAVAFAYRAVNRAPKDANLQRHLISLLFILGDLDAIERALAQALATLPDNPALLRRMSELQIRRKNRALAIVWANRAAEVAPQDGGAQLALSDLLLGDGDLAGARAAIERAVAATPRASHVLRRLSEIALRQSDLVAALDAIKLAIEADTADASNHAHHATVLEGSGRHAEAQKAIREAVRLAPANDGYLRRLAAMSS